MMAVRIQSITLCGGDVLRELVLQSLQEILGPSHEVIAPTLPYDGGPILALDSSRDPLIIAYDARDGGKALLTGLAALEALKSNRTWLLSLYPSLADGTPGGNTAVDLDGMPLLIMAPVPPPGAIYLEECLPHLRVYTFRSLQVNDKLGLLIEPMRRLPGEDSRQDVSSYAPFRAGGAVLSSQEEAYFQAVQAQESWTDEKAGTGK